MEMGRPGNVNAHQNQLCNIILDQFYVLQTITFSFYSIFIDITQTMNNTKLALGTLFGSFIAKALLNIPMMKIFNSVGLSSLYAPIATTLIVQTIAVIFITY